jgi:hypothetical protein
MTHLNVVKREPGNGCLMIPSFKTGFTGTLPFYGVLEIVRLFILSLMLIYSRCRQDISCVSPVNILRSETWGRSIAINYLETLQSKDNSSDTGVVCVYFDHKQDFKPVDILRSLLKDIVLRKGSISRHVNDLHHKHKLRGLINLPLDL